MSTRTEHSIRNVRYGVLFQMAYFVMQFALRAVFVSTLDEVYLGLNGTFGSIIALLSVTELGIGSAITYSMYKPLADGDQRNTAALVNLYRRIYGIIGLAVAGLGLVLVPFLPMILGDATSVPGVYLFYALFVAESVSSYYLVYKHAIIGADQRQYIATAYRFGILLIMCAVQMLFLLLTGDYLWYLVIRVVAFLAINVSIARKADRMYPYLAQNKDAQVDPDTKATIVKNIKAMMLHKVATIAVQGTDNILIASFVGVVQVGKYSNYLMVTNGFNTLFGMVFNALVGSIGNLGATSEAAHIKQAFNRINYMGNVMTGVCAVCMMVLFQPFIAIWVGESWQFPLFTVGVIVANFYVTAMRWPVCIFKDTLGLFWYDRWKAVVEAVVNLVVSVILVLRFGVMGVLLGTLFSTFTVVLWWETSVLYKHGFKTGVVDYLVRWLKNLAVTLVAGTLCWLAVGAIPLVGVWGWLLKAVVCVALAGAVFLACYCKSPDQAYFLDLAKRRLGK